MMTFRKALLAALVVLTFLYLLRRSHNPSPLDPTDSELAPSQSTEKESGIPADSGINGMSTAVPGASGSGGRISQVIPNRKSAKHQQALVNVKEKSLRAQLAYQFPYDVESKFPAYVWQTWKYTPASGDFAEQFRQGEASWTEKHPGFVHEVITDQVAEHLLGYLYASVPQVMEAYNALPLPVLKADLFRYLILLARGGIYTDIDTIAIKSAADWLPPNFPLYTVGLVIGIEADPDRADWEKWYSRRIQFCQWTIQAKPGHPVLREIVAHIVEETLKQKAIGNFKNKSVVEFTGPAIWTDIIFDYFNDERYFDMTNNQENITWKDFTGIKEAKKVGDVVVLPITSFSPGVGQMGAGEPDDPMAFVKHDFEGTWKPESERHIKPKED